MDQNTEHSSNAQRGFRVQAPLVDSVSCYCKVDAGFKTVAGARKFVPGSKICIQPDINPNAHRGKNLRRERTRIQPPLLPGLPDDLAIACLIRVPRCSKHDKLTTALGVAYALCKARVEMRSIVGASVEPRQSSLASDLVCDWRILVSEIEFRATTHIILVIFVHSKTYISNSTSKHFLKPFERLFPLNLELVSELFDEGISHFIHVAFLIIRRIHPAVHRLFLHCILLFLLHPFAPAGSSNLLTNIHRRSLLGKFNNQKGLINFLTLDSARD
ncbi:hypothetical protein DVH24_038033 [Malus domestica]|uniref:Uncharacterized protein n=1 Tax=Malus domestica TaxID=3750 RepID=A0A498K666_MALDO|nr:hypothetical protein DVH24_038033 [Malus domestica]